MASPQALPPGRGAVGSQDAPLRAPLPTLAASWAAIPGAEALRLELAGRRGWSGRGGELGDGPLPTRYLLAAGVGLGPRARPCAYVRGSQRGVEQLQSSARQGTHDCYLLGALAPAAVGILMHAAPGGQGGASDHPPSSWARGTGGRRGGGCAPPGRWAAPAREEAAPLELDLTWHARTDPRHCSLNRTAKSRNDAKRCHGGAGSEASCGCGCAW